MTLSLGQVTLIDLVDQINRKETIVNKTYQRGSGVWPDSARTYFIDTILEGYPFPKIYLYQVFNPKAHRPIKEIVDGQQRISTILDFINNKFALTSVSSKFSKMKFEDLSEEDNRAFLSYQIEFSLILSATRSELLEMFRRINAYTAPLTPAEKRHSMYQGAFKWFINEQADMYSEILENLKIFTPKQLARMADAEFIADLVVALENGIVTKTSKNIENLYKKHDNTFEKYTLYGNILKDFFSVLSNELTPLHSTFMMKSYVVHSLFCAFSHCKYGLPNVTELTSVVANPNIVFNYELINVELENLANAHEEQVETGPYLEYVNSCLSSTTKLPQRKIRFRIFADILTRS